MERVAGIGGFFFTARDPAALATWYETHLGIPRPPDTYDETSWWPGPGPTVFAPAGADAEHLAGSPWALNLRVVDLDAMVSQLRAAGIAVEPHQQVYPNGRFAELVDPEGNPLQLWEPAGNDAQDPRADHN